MKPVINKKEPRKTPRKPKGLGIRYSDIDVQKRIEIYNFVMEKAKEMVSENKLNFHELSRIIMKNYGVYVWPMTIRDWIVKGKHPLRSPQLNPITKAVRRPPELQIIPETLGLLYSDLHFHTACNTLVLSLTTPYEAFARKIALLYSKYGHTSIAPTLCGDEPEWRLYIYLDRTSWNKVLTTPLSSLNKEEIRVFLTRVIDGDGWLTLQYRKRRPTFYISISTCYAEKAKILSELFQRLGHQATICVRMPRTYNVSGRVIRQKRREYTIILYRKGDVTDFLYNAKFLHPMKEVKRVWALKMINSGLDSEKSRRIWRYLHQVEKTAKLYSKLKSALILSEKYDISNIVRDLREKYAESVRFLRQLQATLTV
jgi:hypothetical protein